LSRIYIGSRGSLPKEKNAQYSKGLAVRGTAGSFLYEDLLLIIGIEV
jgi:hypothetical protein